MGLKFLLTILILLPPLFLLLLLQRRQIFCFLAILECEGWIGAFGAFGLGVGLHEGGGLGALPVTLGCICLICISLRIGH